MKQSWKHNVELVTGEEQVIVLATAQAFAEAGVMVFLSDVLDTFVQTQALIDKGYKAASYPCDVTDEKAVEAMLEHIVRTTGRLDAAYNNAGINSPVAETADASSEEYDRVMNINLRGIWNCMKYELRQMRKQKSGAIVNCSSIGGLIGIAERGVYHASKHGVIGMRQRSALQYAARGLNITALCQGLIETPLPNT